MQIQALLSPSSHLVPRPALWGLAGTGVFPHRVWDPDTRSAVLGRVGSHHVARSTMRSSAVPDRTRDRLRFRLAAVAGCCKALPVFVWDEALVKDTWG